MMESQESFGDLGSGGTNTGKVIPAGSQLLVIFPSQGSRVRCKTISSVYVGFLTGQSDGTALS